MAKAHPKFNFLKIFILLGLLTIKNPAKSASLDEINIINARRNIQMSDTDVVHRDYYLNAGEEAGLKKNMVLNVFRKANIRDASGSTSFGEIEFPVGQVIIIASYPRISIAREYSLMTMDENPIVDISGFMVGDRIETKGNFIEDKAQKKKRVAENQQNVEPSPQASPTQTSTPINQLPNPSVNTTETAVLAPTTQNSPTPTESTTRTTSTAQKPAELINADIANINTNHSKVTEVTKELEKPKEPAVQVTK